MKSMKAKLEAQEDGGFGEERFMDKIIRDFEYFLEKKYGDQLEDTKALA
jgi:hypothetical protein